MLVQFLTTTLDLQMRGIVLLLDPHRLIGKELARLIIQALCLVAERIGLVDDLPPLRDIVPPDKFVQASKVAVMILGTMDKGAMLPRCRDLVRRKTILVI